MKRTTKNKGLSNPAVLAAASSPAGQKAITDFTGMAKASAETSSKIAVEVVPFLIKIAVAGVIIYYVVNKFTKRFVKLGYNTNLAAANISDGQASAKANAIYEAMYGPGANMELVASQIRGLNYNGWIKVYNAFGQKAGANPFGDDLNLSEWLVDQFSTEDIAQLRFVLPGVF